MDVQVINKNGQASLLSDYGIQARDFIVSSIELRTNYQEVEGASGRRDYGADYGARIIRVPFWFQSQDAHDFPLQRDRLFGEVNGRQSFFVRELRLNLEKNKFIGGKRYLVRLQNRFELEQIVNAGLGELVFETTELPFAESVGTSQDIQDNGIDASDALWGFGMGLIADNESLLYTHTGTSFKIFNPGNEPVHPFEQDIRITIDDVQGSNEYLQLENTTNGTAFRVTEGVSNCQEIMLDGANILSNGLAFLRNTNRSFIKLEPGWNDFTVTGASNARVAFDFRFYYR